MSAELFAALDAKVGEAKGLISAGKLRSASAAIREAAELVSIAAEKSDGLLSDSTGQAVNPWEVGGAGGPADLTSCQRGAHSDGPIDRNGWTTCGVCGRVNLFPKVAGERTQLSFG